MENVWIAFIVAFFGLLTAGMPILMARQTAKAAAESLTAATVRADELANRVAAVANQAAKAADLLAVNTGKVAEATKMTSDKLDIIHTLVNSSMTKAMQSEYDATVRELAMMHEVIALKRLGGQEPSIMAMSAIAATEEKLSELKAVLKDRLKQAQVVEMQLDNQKRET